MNCHHFILSSLGGYVFASLLIACSSEPRGDELVKQPAEQSESESSIADPVNSDQQISSSKTQLPKFSEDISSLSPAEVFQAAYGDVAKSLVEGRNVKSFQAGDPEISTRLQKSWLNFLSKLGSQQLQDASTGVIEGRLLPNEIVELKEGNMTFSNMLQSGELSFLEGNEELYQAAGLYSSGLLAGSFAGRDMPDFLVSRANQLPPSKADVVAYYAISDGIREIGSGASHAYPVIEELAPYTQSINPIYRLLALEAMAKALLTGMDQPAIEAGEASAKINQARASVLQNYINEVDPVINEKLIEVLSLTPVEESKSMLTTIQEKQKQSGNEALSAKASEALIQIESLMNSNTE